MEHRLRKFGREKVEFGSLSLTGLGSGAVGKDPNLVFDILEVFVEIVRIRR